MRKRKIAIDSHKQRKKQKSRVPSLSDEIVFNILSWVSAEFLHNVGRFVCKSWDTMISTTHFIETHISQSNPVFFFNDSSEFECFSFIELKGGKLLGMRCKEKVPGRLLDSSDGCLLLKDSNCLFVKNPVTGQVLALPPFLVNRNLIFLNASIAWLSHSRKIKVICKYESRLHSNSMYWNILTVDRNMSWRMLNETTPRPQLIPNWVYRSEAPLFSVGDFVIDRSDWYCEKRFLAIDLHDESFHSVHGPPVEDQKTLRGLIPMGRNLYAVSIMQCSSSPPNVYDFRIWKMRNFRRSEWVEVFRIEIDDKMGLDLNHQDIYFHAWLENHRILIFKKVKMTMYNVKMIAYNFRLRKKYFVKVDGRKRCFVKVYGPHLWHHTSSLDSW